MRQSAPTPGNNRQEKAELEAVLASKTFVRAPSIAKLLSYLCGKYFNGEIDQIKEYTIATELFKRTGDFHSKEDPIVRVEANRLRAKLKEYYGSEGKNHPIQIFIPSGQYAPEFHAQGSPAREYDHEGSDVDPYAGSPDQERVGPNEGAAVDAQVSARPALVASTTTEHVGRRMHPLLLVALSVAALALVVGGTLFYRSQAARQRSSGSSFALPEAAPPSAAVMPSGPILRIMCGSNLATYADRFGRVWVGDRYFIGGEVITSSPTSLLRAEDSQLSKVSRQGEFEYSIPLKPGIYELHLHFVEMLFGTEPEEGGETSRLFDILANGQPLLELFDVYSDAGGCGKMDERVFTDISPAADGLLHLAFRPNKAKALLNGLEILPGTRGRMLPVRITTRTSNYLSSDQRLWESDRYFSGGRSVVRIHSVLAPKDPELYQSERYGNFTYSIPAAQGLYTVTFKFAETYFGTGPTNPPGPGPGLRLFDVYCNGQTLLKDFDIFTEAGGANRAMDKVFHGLKPNAQGKLVLSFVPVKNYACVNAIEVVPE